MEIDKIFATVTPYVYILKALFILVIGFVAAKIVHIFVDRFLFKLASRTHLKIDDLIVRILHTPIVRTVQIISVIFTTNTLNPPAPYDFYIIATLRSLLIVLWAFSIIRLSTLILDQSTKDLKDVTGIAVSLIPLFKQILKIGLFVLTGFHLLSIWHINITPLIASAGLVGMAVALAAKDTLSNFFGGVSIFVDRPYKLGDYIILDSGERGEVVDIGVRSTRIKTRDDILISIPNSVMANTKIVNESAPEPRFRVRIPVGVAYGSDTKKVEELLINIASEISEVVKEPVPRVRLRRLGDSALEYELLCWVYDPMLKGKTIHKLNTMIHNRFEKEGILIPFPQRDIHIKDYSKLSDDHNNGYDRNTDKKEA